MASECSPVLQYIRLQQMSVGCWPLFELEGNSDARYHYFRWFMFFTYTLKILLEFIYICNHTGNFYALGEMFIIFLTGCLYQVRMTNILFRMPIYCDMLKCFRDKICLFSNKNPTPFHKKVADECEGSGKVLLMCLFAAYMVGHNVFYSIPILVNWMIGAYDKGSEVRMVLPLTLALPFDTGFHKVAWSIMFVIEFIYGYISLASTFCQDAFYCYMVLHVKGQLAILVNDIKNLISSEEEERKEDDIMKNMVKSGTEEECFTFSTDEEIRMYGKLKKCIEHHQLIISFVAKLQSAWGVVLMTNFFYNLVSICLLGFQLTATSWETVVRFGMFSFGCVGQLVIICVFSDSLADKSLLVAQEVYDIDWPSMSSRTKRILVFLLARSQKPMQMTALGLADVSVQTMSYVLKSSFSYFTILKTLEE